MHSNPGFPHSLTIKFSWLTPAQVLPLTHFPKIWQKIENGFYNRFHSHTIFQFSSWWNDPISPTCSIFLFPEYFQIFWVPVNHLITAQSTCLHGPIWVLVFQFSLDEMNHFPGIYNIFLNFPELSLFFNYFLISGLSLLHLNSLAFQSFFRWVGTRIGNHFRTLICDTMWFLIVKE